MIHILVEENYSKNSRFISLLEGISLYLRRRHDEYKVYKTPEELPADCRVVAVICQSQVWSVDMVAKLNSMNIHPLIFGFRNLDTMYSYSSLSPDYAKSAYRLASNIIRGEPHSLAVLGYNPDSLPDRFKLSGIKYAVKESGGSCEVFENGGDIVACFESFRTRAKDFDKIVCCNDSIAILLLSKYKELAQDKEICSCTGEMLSRFLKSPYPVCRINYVMAGEKLASLYRFLSKGERISSIAMTLDMDFACEDTTPAFTPAHNAVGSGNKVDFYGDSEICKIELLNAMLLDADSTDIIILSELEGGATYEKISENHYISVNALKYRTKKMMKNARVSSKKELLSRLREYGLSFNE